MLIGLGDDDGIPEYLRRPAEDADPSWSPMTFPTSETSESTITIYPATVKKKVVPRVGPTKALDAVLPRTLSPTGALKIFGLPPAVAYALAALLLTGAGLAAYKTFAGDRRTARNPRRPSGRGGKARRKR